MYDTMKFFEKAAQNYEKLIQIQPSNSNYYFSYVERDIQSQKCYHINKCWKYLSKGLSISNKKDYKYYYLKGQILLVQRKFQEAIKAFKKSINLKNDFDDCYLDLYQAYKSKGQMKQAVANLQRLIAINPKQNRAWNNLANYYLYHSEFSKFQQIIGQMNNLPISFFATSIGSYYLHTGQVEKAIQHYQQWLLQIKVQRRKSLVYYHLYKCYAAIDNWQKAAAVLALKKNTKRMKIKQTIELGLAYLKTNNFLCCTIIIDEIQQMLMNLELQLIEVVLFLDLLVQASKFDKCMQIYDSWLILSKSQLSLQSNIQLSIIMIQCHFKDNQVCIAFQIYDQLYKIMMKNAKMNTDLIAKFIDIQIMLFQYTNIEPFYRMMQKNIETKSVEGDILQKMIFRKQMQKYKKIVENQRLQTNKGLGQK